ncbi:MAG: ABC transporter ATP-binding protein [Actinomycetota bacterium]|nr:ABC transporter ATP-binding protein [Actinomycetota bacterium]
MSEAPMIEAVGLRKTYDHGRVEVLRDVHLTVEPGEFVAISGASGSGKSTLLHLLAALDRPTAGTVRVNGHDLSGRVHDVNGYRRRIGLVFQLHNLLPHLAAARNVELAMFGTHHSPSERAQRAVALLDDLQLGYAVHRSPARLSGGERQRVAIARALANEPKVLLADEPTGSLDAGSIEVVFELFDSLRAKGLTIVMVTHDSAVAARADRQLTLNQGTLART